MARPESSINRVVRLMVSIPRTLLGEMSRMMDDIMGIRGQWSTNQLAPPNSSNLAPVLVSNEWDFLTTFEQQFGTFHPFFYACKFQNVVKMAQDEHRLIFIYLHNPGHTFATNFCMKTLCSELGVEFLDANFVSWGAIASPGEGYHLATILKPASFPFCAVVAACDNLDVLQQIEGPVSSDELVEILQGTLEEQGLAFGSERVKNEEEQRRVDTLLREEQDAAYLATLMIDQERDKEKAKVNNHQEKLKQNTIFSSKSPNSSQTGINKGSNIGEPTKVLVRFPNGERREKSFVSTEKIEAIFGYIDSLGLSGINGKYRLISSFPKKVYGVEQMDMTLKEAGLLPQASLFLEFL